ncbi:hypothetical protein JOC55_003171 [Paenibacillus sacheonensis]|nr:hypothetical protein [Paenibacillus sacheonensis]
MFVAASLYCYCDNRAPLRPSRFEVIDYNQDDVAEKVSEKADVVLNLASVSPEDVTKWKTKRSEAGRSASLLFAQF